jgi:uncharacterized protein (DUF2267 family)
MTRAILRISSSPQIEQQARDLVLRVWKSGQSTVEAADAIRVVLDAMREPLPALSLAQAYAANIVARHQDALHAARRQEMRRVSAHPSTMTGDQAHA